MVEGQSPRSGPGSFRSSLQLSLGSAPDCSSVWGLCKGSEKGPEDTRTIFNCRPGGKERSTGFEVRLGLDLSKFLTLSGFLFLISERE